MSQNKELIEKLLALWQDPTTPVLDTKGKRYFILSDVHLGDGGQADDFHNNERILETALECYNKWGYSLILLGDIEEMWQFDQKEIEERYKGSIYKKIRSFGDDRVYRVFGNHDINWQTLPDPAKNMPLWCHIATEALKLHIDQSDTTMFLVHGHQGSVNSDKAAWSSRFWVRFLKPFERIGRKLRVYRNPSITKTKVKKSYEKIMASWVNTTGIPLICGHSHRAVFSDTPPYYFNTGCALYRNGITGIEIAGGRISLVKWQRDSQQVEIYGEKNLNEIN